MMTTASQFQAISNAKAIFNSATPVIHISGVGGPLWRRNVASGGRVGPWLQGDYSILNRDVWGEKKPCLYLVGGSDGVVRYVGISRNRMKDRWRESPAIDAQTGQLLPKKQLFHSQCWKRIEEEQASGKRVTYDVRCISGEKLKSLLAQLGAPLSAFAALGDDHEGIAAAVERWICNNNSSQLVPWNIAMTSAR